MGLFDDLGNALKKIGDEVKKTDIDKHLKTVEQGLNKAEKDISTEIKKGQVHPRSASPALPVTASSPSLSPPAAQAVPRSPHKGYAKIVAWMKRNYRDRISSSGTNFQQGLQLEQLTAEACSGLSAKARKGFMDYLKKQNYEPLLK